MTEGGLHHPGRRPAASGPGGHRALYDALENARLYTELRHYAGTLEEQVERERTAQLAAQYARLEAILRSTGDGILLTDARGEILQANPRTRGRWRSRYRSGYGPGPAPPEDDPVGGGWPGLQEEPSGG
jgi:hypothetical protein